MVLINVVLIGFMVARPKMPPRGKPVDLKNIISEKLNLDEEQQETYFELAKNHGELMAEIEQKQKPLIRDYFSFLKSEDQNFSTQDSLLTEINILESEKLIMTYNHFEQLKEICNPSQQVLFEEIIGDLIQDLLGIQKKRLPRPRD